MEHVEASTSSSSSSSPSPNPSEKTTEWVEQEEHDSTSSEKLLDLETVARHADDYGDGSNECNPEYHGREYDEEVGDFAEGGEEGAMAADGAEEGRAGGVDDLSGPTDVTGIDRLLQRHRNEIMFELRKLKFGDKPVTGGDNRRRAVEALVRRCVAPRPPSRSSRVERSLSILSTSASAAPEPQRPEQVLVEVNALVERRPVSSILQSLGFRRSLETSLRGAISTIERRSLAQTAQTVRSRVEQFENPSTLSQQHQQQDDSQQSSLSATSSRRMSLTSFDNEVTANTPRQSVNDTRVGGSAQYGAGIDLAAAGRVGFQGNFSLPVTEPAIDGPQRAHQWLQEHVTAPVPDYRDDQLRMSNIELLHEMQRENLIMDISQLIQSHLVTSALEGDIRHRLERRMMHHLQQSGHDGRRVQEQLSQLPRNYVHRRNDFYDLGIIGGAGGAGAAGNDQMDNVSVISATAAVAVPQAYAQSQQAMSREMRSLRTQVAELRNMVQLSFDLQLDIQRAIRQEVAAALSSQSSTSATPVAATSSSIAGVTGARRQPSVRNQEGREPASDVTDNQCLICLEKAVDTVLYQCGHMCLCYACGMQLRQRGGPNCHCPVCRAPIRDIIKAYRN